FCVAIAAQFAVAFQNLSRVAPASATHLHSEGWGRAAIVFQTDAKNQNILFSQYANTGNENIWTHLSTSCCAGFSFESPQIEGNEGKQRGGNRRDEIAVRVNNRSFA